MVAALKAVGEEIIFILLIPVYLVLAPALLIIVVAGVGIIAAGIGAMVMTGEPNWAFIGAGFAVLIATFTLLALVDQLYRWIAHN